MNKVEKDYKRAKVRRTLGWPKAHDRAHGSAVYSLLEYNLQTHWCLQTFHRVPWLREAMSQYDMIDLHRTATLEPWSLEQQYTYSRCDL